MDILDKDLREYFKGLSIDDLKEKFADGNSFGSCFAIRYELKTFGGNLNCIIDSNGLKKISETVRMTTDNPNFNEFDNTKANPTQEELENSELFFGMPLTRKISEEELTVLARQVLLERKGEKFAQLSTDDMKKKFEEIIERAKQAERDAKDEEEGVILSQEIRFSPNSKYGINTNEMQDIWKIVLSRKFMAELVGGIPKKELRAKKEKFESLRNAPIFHYNSREDEMDFLMRETFGEFEYPEYVDKFFINNHLPVVEIEDAFEERLKEIEKGENKEGKGLFSRIKDWFSRRGQKALPEGQTQKQEGNNAKAKKDFKDALRVSPEDMIDTGTLNDDNQKNKSIDNDGPSID